MKTETLNYTTAFINRNFLIKVSGVDNELNRIHKLVGVSGAVNLIGAELLNKFIDRTIKSRADKCTCKLRRGIKVTFYLK